MLIRSGWSRKVANRCRRIWIRAAVPPGARFRRRNSSCRKGSTAVWSCRRVSGEGALRYASAALARFLPLVPVRPLYAGLAKSNIASRRVLEKSGFEVIRDEDGDLFMRLDCA